MRNPEVAGSIKDLFREPRPRHFALKQFVNDENSKIFDTSEMFAVNISKKGE